MTDTGATDRPAGQMVDRTVYAAGPPADRLAMTGSEQGPLAALALALVLMGGLLLRTGVRRTHG